MKKRNYHITIPLQYLVTVISNFSNYVWCCSRKKIDVVKTCSRTMHVVHTMIYIILFGPSYYRILKEPTKIIWHQTNVTVISYYVTVLWAPIWNIMGSAAKNLWKVLYDWEIFIWVFLIFCGRSNISNDWFDVDLFKPMMKLQPRWYDDHG